MGGRPGMRFRKVEISPAGKKQYFIALGAKDIEILLGLAKAGIAHTPRTDEGKPLVSRMRSILKGLSEADSIAKADGDDGSRVPVNERHKFAEPELDPMKLVTRMEIIRDTECPTCKGFGLEKIDKNIKENLGNLHTCGLCGGSGNAGREVIFNDYTKMVESSLQDGGRTLKLFIKKRPQVKMGTIDCNTGKAMVEALKDLVPPKSETVYFKRPWWVRDKAE